MNKILPLSSVILLCCAASSFANPSSQVYYPQPQPQLPPPSTRDRGLIAFDIKKIENQIADLERAIRYERTGSSPSHVVIQGYEQQILLLRQQLVRLNIEYANARPY